MNPNSTNGANILSPGLNYRSIDNDLSFIIQSEIFAFLSGVSGKDVVPMAKDMRLPVFDP